MNLLQELDSALSQLHTSGCGHLPAYAQLYALRQSLLVTATAVHESGGTCCPFCSQHMQVYNRDLDSGLGYALLFMRTHSHLADAEGWLHMPTYAPRSVLRAKNFGLLAHWGLVERRQKSDANPRAPLKGYWRVTPLGVAFADQHTHVPKTVVLYDGKVIGYRGGCWSIQDSLGTEFQWHTLVSGPWSW